MDNGAATVNAIKNALTPVLAKLGQGAGTYFGWAVHRSLTYAYANGVVAAVMLLVAVIGTIVFWLTYKKSRDKYDKEYADFVVEYKHDWDVCRTEEQKRYEEYMAVNASNRCSPPVRNVMPDKIPERWGYVFGWEAGSAQILGVVITLAATIMLIFSVTTGIQAVERGLNPQIYAVQDVLHDLGVGQ